MFVQNEIGETQNRIRAYLGALNQADREVKIECKWLEQPSRLYTLNTDTDEMVILEKMTHFSLMLRGNQPCPSLMEGN